MTIETTFVMYNAYLSILTIPLWLIKNNDTLLLVEKLCSAPLWWIMSVNR